MHHTRLVCAATCLAVLLGLFACARGTGRGDGDDDDDGAGGGAWGAGSGVSTSTSTSTSGSTGSGTSLCDGMAVCATCAECSRNSGACAPLWSNCSNNLDCVDYNNCVAGCADGDTLCLTDCDSFYPAGSEVFGIYADCVVCQDCYVDCEGATASCP
jgi:hypothetical protein